MSPSSTRAPRDKRRVPRIGQLDYASRCRFGERDEVTSLRLRDLSVDGVLLEAHEADLPPFENDEVTFLEASVPQMGLYLHCRAQVTRREAEVIALKFMDLDPATKGIIRSLYPADTEWSEPES